MKKQIIFMMCVFLLKFAVLPVGMASELGAFSVSVTDAANGENKLAELEEEKFTETFLHASTGINDMFNALSETAEGDVAESFQLGEVEIGLGVTASAGLLVWSVGAEGGVVLHYTKRE